ncbi:MAG TPA: hypothetical protein VGV85_13940 [Longimicrobiaceae bacterium]|nr:hypothetical protein [Longimicrobiaceae bacterium]
MRRAAILLPLGLLAVLPVAAHAQGGRLVPYAGLSVGGSSLPRVFQGCAPDPGVAADARVGLARGALALEARLSGLADLAVEDCAVAAEPFTLPDGVHTTMDYPFHGADAHVAGDLRLRLGGTRALPLVVSGGAGWLSPTDVPYLLAAAGARLGGRFRLAVDVERSWYRVEGTEYVLEWRDHRPIREISRQDEVAWMDGTGVRLGVELAFR